MVDGTVVVQKPDDDEFEFDEDDKPVHSGGKQRVPKRKQHAEPREEDEEEDDEEDEEEEEEDEPLELTFKKPDGKYKSKKRAEAVEEEDVYQSDDYVEEDEEDLEDVVPKSSGSICLTFLLTLN